MGASRPRVLVLTADVVGARMAGPAIRALELARALTGACDVTLLSSHAVDLADPPCATGSFTGRADLEPLVERADVVVAMPALLWRFEWIADHDVVVVADAYDPVVFEVLAWFGDAPRHEQDQRFADSLAVMVEPLRFADAVLCASERQRHLLVGVLTALGRVNPRTYGADPSLDRLVAVVPFGLPATPPQAGTRPLRGDGGPFGADDLVLLWGGGLHQWLDPLSLIEAVHLLDRRDVKVFIAGGVHPTPDVPAMPIADEARARAAELGLLGDRVVFAQEWVPYEQRADLLLDADVGVSLHHRHVETTFAFRTRMLDYLWAQLPVLCSDGDSLADLVRDRGLGVVAEPDDPASVAAAIVELADATRREGCRRAIASVAPEYSWPVVSEPLVALCAAPARAPDRLGSGRARAVGTDQATDRGGLRAAVDRVTASLRAKR